MFTFETADQKEVRRFRIAQFNGRTATSEVRKHHGHRAGSLGAGKHILRAAALDHHADPRSGEGKAGRAAARTALQQLR